MSKLSLEQFGPSLFIGLGGAGGHVVARLNRLADEAFAEDYDRLGDSRPFQFLLLDTDDFEKLDDSVRRSLDKPQQSFVSLSHFNPRRYAEKQLELPDTDLKRWFDKDALPYLEDVTIHDGASRLRMLGRLCLHRHYETVEQRIREKVDAALDAGVHRESTRIRPEPPPLRIYLVASSCGGTGSAIFLDIAFLVNRIVRDRGWSPDLTGFVFLPFPYIEANSKLDPALEAFYEHNAWAFFEELNYFLAHPEKIPEHALDPERRYWDPARPLDDYGRDLMRTIYLIGNHIPTIGTLELGNRLYEYAARGIFHTFLTPDEGAIQSHYSNIKSKLKDRDRKYGLVKRFAAFGYAEYQPSGDTVSKGVEELVHGEWQRLRGQPAGEEAREREARKLFREFERGLDPFRHQAGGWKPALGIEDLDDPVGELDVSEIHGLLDVAQAQGDRQRDSILAEVRKASRDLIGRILRERLEDPAWGVEMELAVVERLRQDIERLRQERLDRPQPPAFASDEVLRKQVAEVARSKPVPKRYFGRLERRVDAAERDRFINALHDLEVRIRKAAGDWLAAAVDRGVGEVVGDTVLPLLDDHIRTLRTLTGILQDYAPPQPPPADGAKVPTIQEVPPAGLLEASGFKDDLERLRANEAAKSDVRAAWGRFIARIASAEVAAGDAAQQLKNELAEIWRSRVSKGFHYENALDAVRDWARRMTASEGDVERCTRTLLARLYPLSAPACPLDEAALDKSDSVAKVFAVVGPFDDDDEAKDRLQIPYPCSLLGNTRNKIAVLQSWYAFSSRAIEGMDSLRRSYLRRDRTLSLPHIDKRWNAEGLFQSTGAGDLNERDEILVARLLALGPLLERADGELAFGRRFRLQRDERDTAPKRLLTYQDSGYGHTFHWRDVRRRDGYDGSWIVLQSMFAARNGNRDDTRGESDLITDLRAYLVSEARERHEEVLTALSEIERTEAGTAIVEAYRRYLDALVGAIADEERRGRIKYISLLRRLHDRLDEYVRSLDHEEPVGL
jgi:hypothetical protein